MIVREIDQSSTEFYDLESNKDSPLSLKFDISNVSLFVSLIGKISRTDQVMIEKNEITCHRGRNIFVL